MWSIEFSGDGDDVALEKYNLVHENKLCAISDLAETKGLFFGDGTPKLRKGKASNNLTLPEFW